MAWLLGLTGCEECTADGPRGGAPAAIARSITSENRPAGSQHESLELFLRTVGSWPAFIVIAHLLPSVKATPALAARSRSTAPSGSLRSRARPYSTSRNGDALGGAPGRLRHLQHRQQLATIAAAAACRRRPPPLVAFGPAGEPPPLSCTATTRDRLSPVAAGGHGAACRRAAAAGGAGGARGRGRR